MAAGDDVPPVELALAPVNPSALETELARALPGIFQRARIIISPYPFGVAGDDNLRIISFNATPGVIIECDFRFLATDRSIKSNRVLHTPNSDRSLKQQDYQLGAGFVTNVTVRASSGTPILGSCFVIVQLIRGLTGATIPLGTLLAGTMTSTQALGWPGSAIENSLTVGYTRLITGTTPAAGAEVNELVPTGARWEVSAFIAKLTTSAAALTRNPNLFVDDNSATPYAANGVPVGLAPSNFQSFVWLANYPNLTPLAAQPIVGPLVFPARLLAGHRMRTLTGNLDVADQWASVRYLVNEFLEG